MTGYVCQDCKPMHSGKGVWLCPKHAAAPQLLEALRLLDEHLAAVLDPEHCLHHVADSRNVMIDLRETARAAIKAAGG